MSTRTMPSAGVAGLEEVFERCRGEDRAALIGYLPVGDPDVARSVEAMVALVESGVDIIEVGVPYSDPLMDGPTVQHAVERALAGGTRVADTFTAVRAVHEAGAPALVMTAWNLVLHRGVEQFADELARAGGAGLITPDFIPDEAGEWMAAAARHDLAKVFLVAPSSTPQRLDIVARASSGFVYAAAVMGVTGARAQVGAATQGLVERTKTALAQTDTPQLPVCVGLGVSSGEQAAQIAGYADGVIVGSALVTALEQDPSLGRLRELATELAAGVRRGRR